MKLYTEKQLVNAIQITVMDKPVTYAEVIEKLTPIELPNDEEIEEWIVDNKNEFTRGCIAGAKWVIEQIKQQADGK